MNGKLVAIVQDMLILFLIYSSLQNMLEYAFLMGRVKFETKFGNEESITYVKYVCTK